MLFYSPPPSRRLYIIHPLPTSFYCSHTCSSGVQLFPKVEETVTKMVSTLAETQGENASSSKSMRVVEADVPSAAPQVLEEVTQVATTAGEDRDEAWRAEKMKEDGTTKHATTKEKLESGVLLIEKDFVRKRKIIQVLHCGKSCIYACTHTHTHTYIYIYIYIYYYPFPPN